MDFEKWLDEKFKDNSSPEILVKALKDLAREAYDMGEEIGFQRGVETVISERFGNMGDPNKF